MGEARFGRKGRQGRGGGHDQALQLVSKQNYLYLVGCQVDFETLLTFKRQSCQRAKRRNSCCWWGGSCKPRAMTGNSALPNGWRCASSPARTRSPRPRRHSRNFKRRPVAPHHKPLRRLRQVGTWSDSNPRRMGAASVCDCRTKVRKRLRAIRSKFWCAPCTRSTPKSKPRCTMPCTKC